MATTTAAAVKPGAAELPLGCRWVDTMKASAAVKVDSDTVADWARRGLVLARRLPGQRGIWRIAVDASGWPVELDS
jgi:transposase-like protein